MLSVIGKCGRLIGNMGKGRWFAVISLGLVMSGVEAVGALLVYLLLGMVTGTDAPEVPVFGDLEHLLPGWTDTSLFLLVSGLIGMFFVVRGALLILQGYVESRVVENTGARLARRLVRGYLSLPYSMHVRRNSAKSIRNAFDTVQIMLHDGLLPMVRLVGEGLLVMGILVVLAITAPIATLLAVGVIGPMSVGLIRLVHPRLKALGQAGQRDTQASLQALQQSLHGMRDIILLGRERYFEGVFTRSRTQLARTRYIRGTLKQVPRAAVETILVLTIAGFFAVTVLLDGSATGALPVLGLFGYAVMRLKPSLNTMMASVNSLRFADAAIEDLEGDLALTESVKKEHRAGTESPPLTFERELALRDITFRYDGSKEDALRGISLVIPRGVSVGFVGPTGCGKSTLMDILSGLLEPTSGAVTVDGIDIHDRGKEWRSGLGVVPQSVFLVDDTLRRNIAFGLPDESIDEAALLQAVRMAQLDEFVASLPAGLDTIVGEAGIRLSGGERQRVAIARALYRQPDVLIFDEGTSALDNRTEAHFLQVLKGLEGQRTMITVAHRLSTVRRCDTIFVMSGGSISDVGTFDELADRAAISVP